MKNAKKIGPIAASVKPRAARQSYGKVDMTGDELFATAAATKRGRASHDWNAIASAIQPGQKVVLFDGQATTPATASAWSKGLRNADPSIVVRNVKNPNGPGVIVGAYRPE